MRRDARGVWDTRPETGARVFITGEVLWFLPASHLRCHFTFRSFGRRRRRGAAAALGLWGIDGDAVWGGVHKGQAQVTPALPPVPPRGTDLDMEEWGWDVPGFQREEG